MGGGGLFTLGIVFKGILCHCHVGFLNYCAAWASRKAPREEDFFFLGGGGCGVRMASCALNKWERVTHVLFILQLTRVQLLTAEQTKLINIYSVYRNYQHCYFPTTTSTISSLYHIFPINVWNVCAVSSTATVSHRKVISCWLSDLACCEHISFHRSFKKWAPIPSRVIIKTNNIFFVTLCFVMWNVWHSRQHVYVSHIAGVRGAMFTMYSHIIAPLCPTYSSLPILSPCFFPQEWIRRPRWKHCCL